MNIDLLNAFFQANLGVEFKEIEHDPTGYFALERTIQKFFPEL